MESSTVDFGRDDELRAAASAALERSFAPGLAVALSLPGGATRSQLLGYGDLAAREPVEAATLFEIGSISKSFTCALLMMAKEEGVLELDGPVKDYLPWFEVRSRFAPISLRHLATHSAGIVMGTEFSGDAAFEVWSLRDTETTTEPGTWFHYSNVGYKVLGLVIEAVRQRPYHVVLREQLLDPLGMESSEPAITHEVRRRLAVGYEPFYDDRAALKEHGVAPATWVESATADGSIAATAEDMALWLRFIIDSGVTAKGERLLSGESLQEMLEPAVVSGDELHGSHYGLGLWTVEVDGHRYAGHTGGMVGYHAALCCDLDEGIGVVALANGLGPWRELTFQLLALARSEGGGEPADYMAPAGQPPEPEPEEVAPPELSKLVGHYRSHNPWVPNLRVRFRSGALWAEFPSGDVWSHELELVPLGSGLFRVGSDARSPERLLFDTEIDGRAVRADYSGCSLYRTFTP